VESYRFLYDIALILLSTKIFGLLTRKLQMPQVVGALIAGIIFGPALFNILHLPGFLEPFFLKPTDFLSHLSEIGVIVIMFSAGMTTDIHELKNAGKSGFLVALIGVLVPLGLGALLGFLFSPDEAGPNLILQHIFIGTILTATSVSITVETLKEIGKLNSKVGNTILAAALIDDVMGLVVLTIVTSLAGADVNIWMVLLKIVLFFVFVAVMAFLGIKGFTWYENRYNKNLHRFPLLAFVLCLGMAFVAERIFGVADIIGAFSAGVIIANTPKGAYIDSKFQPLSYLLLTPIFFANIGLKVAIPEMSWQIVVFAILLVVVAIGSKLIGCGLGAKACGFNWKESVQVGLGMACRGEVALIVANKGAAMGLMPDAYFGPVIIMVVCCAVFTPIALKIAFRVKPSLHAIPETEPSSPLVDRYELTAKLDDMIDEDARKLFFKEEQETPKTESTKNKK
jgi:Kef-type K+ transport system membrane component KefB